jgi:hypothetical protein
MPTPMRVSRVKPEPGRRCTVEVWDCGWRSDDDKILLACGSFDNTAECCFGAMFTVRGIRVNIKCDGLNDDEFSE